MLTEKDIEQFKYAYDTAIRHIIGEDLWNYLETSGFFTAPASTKFHLNYDGGLAEHSTNVASCLLGFTDRLYLKWDRPESPFIVGFLHDLCKADQYIKTPSGYVWNNNQQIKGHGDKSVALCEKHNFKLTDEEKACILYHMGSFTDKEHWNDYTNAIHQYPNVLYTHMADMEATHIVEK